MLTAFGDILNWLAAGVVFPLMFLPLAALLFRRSAIGGALAWAIMVGLTGAASALFVALAPRTEMINFGPRLVYFGAILFALAALIALNGGPRKSKMALADLLERVVRRAGKIVAWLIIVMALVQFAVVILRYVFGVNFIFMQESITYMHGAVFLLAGGYALLTDDHVRIDIFYRTASLKRRALVDFLGTYLLLFPVCLLILWTSTEYVGGAWAVREGSTEQSGIQGVFLLKTLIPAFAVLMILAGFVLAARAGEVLRGER